MSRVKDIPVNVEAKERYLVLVPCEYDGVEMTLFLGGGDNETNSYIELKSNTQGSIFCSNDGDRSWKDGEISNFNMDITGICNYNIVNDIE